MTILRNTFDATMKDKEFTAGIGKGNLELEPLNGSEVETIARKLYQVDQSLVAKLRDISVPKRCSVSSTP